MTFKELEDKIVEEGKMIICSEFHTDTNLTLYYLSRALASKFKYSKTFDFAGLTEDKIKKRISECKKSAD